MALCVLVAVIFCYTRLRRFPCSRSNSCPHCWLVVLFLLCYGDWSVQPTGKLILICSVKWGAWNGHLAVLPHNPGTVFVTFGGEIPPWDSKKTLKLVDHNSYCWGHSWSLRRRICGKTERELGILGWRAFGRHSVCPSSRRVHDQSPSIRVVFFIFRLQHSLMGWGTLWLIPSLIAPGNTLKESTAGSLLAEVLPRCLKPGCFSVISLAQKKTQTS